MRKRLWCVGALTALPLLAAASTASADTTLGSATGPLGSSPMSCGTGGSSNYGTVAGLYSDPSTPDTVPASGGRITAWSTNTTDDTAGQRVSLVVLRPETSSVMIVVARDTEALPNPLPVGDVATFTLATPINVNAGDVIGLAWSGVATCDFYIAPADDVIASFLPLSSPPNAGDALTVSGVDGSYLPAVSANLAPASEDAAVTTSAGPPGASAGNPALLSSSVTNNGPATEPITFTDAVPSGLNVDSAIAGAGTCSISGQTVTCTVSGLSAGQSAPVDVVVTPSSPGSYANHVSVAVASGVVDPNTTNNTASASLNVGGSLPAKCVVPELKGVSSGLAKTVLKDLGCKLKISRAHSKSVHKGSVVKTKPGKGTYAYQTTVTVVVSSGPKKKQHHK